MFVDVSSSGSIMAYNLNSDNNNEATLLWDDDYNSSLNLVADNKKYIYDGCKSTLGSLINKYYPDIPANNWMKIIFNKDRKLQIYDVLVEISDYNKSEFI